MPVINFSVSSHMSLFFIRQKPTPLSNGTARRPLSFKCFLAFSKPLPEEVCFTFLAYLFATASISHNFSPGNLFNFNSDKKLTMSARKEISLNLSRTGCFGPKRQTSRTQSGKTTSSKILTDFSSKFLNGLSCLSESFSSFILCLPIRLLTLHLAFRFR